MMVVFREESFGDSCGNDLKFTSNLNLRRNFIIMALLLQKPPTDLEESRSMLRLTDESAVQIVSRIIKSTPELKAKRFIDLASILRWYEAEGFKYLDFELANMVGPPSSSRPR